ncbi:hypothetical protein ACIRPH_28445 [Nocardiopsis sp. NPDC101807]|uniref:hypothetical protein n=1 Tax=Nocardiopsis sp. NPDC101807 TaxID=3364339 RepID=UPI00381A49CB
MTPPPAVPVPLLFDASPLLHAAKADRLDVLGDLVSGSSCLTTQAVIDEVGRRHPGARSEVVAAAWLTVVPTDSLMFLVAYGEWSARMGLDDDHNIGETTLCAYAELHGGVLVLDDKNARKVATQYGLSVRGTVGLIADACGRGDCTVTGASVLVDDLHESGMRLPFPKGGFEQWAREKKLLG